MGDAYIVRKGGNTGGDITNAVIQEYFAKSGEISPETFVEFCDAYGVIASDDTVPDIGMVGYGTLPLSPSAVLEIQKQT